MDLSDRYVRFASVLRLPPRVRRLPGALADQIRNARRFRWRFSSRHLWGLTLLTASVVIGSYANDFSQAESLRSWERAHTPSALIWDGAMIASGLSRLSESQQAFAARTLPLGTDPAGTVWFQPAPLWIAWFDPTSESGAARIYCDQCQSKPLPARWAPAGRSWAALETALHEAVLERERLRKLPAKAKKAPGFMDSREIRY